MSFLQRSKQRNTKIWRDRSNSSWKSQIKNNLFSCLDNFWHLLRKYKLSNKKVKLKIKTKMKLSTISILSISIWGLKNRMNLWHSKTKLKIKVTLEKYLFLFKRFRKWLLSWKDWKRKIPPQLRNRINMPRSKN